jgi:hypothetical protein
MPAINSSSTPPNKLVPARKNNGLVIMCLLPDRFIDAKPCKWSGVVGAA